MPLYQFWCDHCKEPIEALMSLSRFEQIDEGEPVECPECGNVMRVLIAPPKIVRIN